MAALDATVSAAFTLQGNLFISALICPQLIVRQV